jgi:hypothetical protein
MARHIYNAPYILNSRNKNYCGKVKFLNSTYLISEFCILCFLNRALRRTFVRMYAF